jgi:acetolactate synthase small subunit
MTYDKYQNWLMLIENNDIDELEEEIREEVRKLIPYMDAEDIDITEEEAIEAAEGYVHEE